MFAVQGLNEVRSLEDLRQASELGGVVATDGHMPRGVEVSVPICDQSDRRYDAALVGGHVARLVAGIGVHVERWQWSYHGEPILQLQCRILLMCVSARCVSTRL